MSELYQAKLRRLRGFMAANGVDTLVLSRLDNVAWLGCGAKAQVPLLADQAVAWFVITADRVTLVTNNIEAPRLADEELGGLELEWAVTPWYEQDYEAAAASVAVGRVAGDTATAGRELVDLQPLRYALFEPEQAAYRRLGADVGAAIAAVAHSAVPGETEFALAGRLAAALFEREVWPVVILVAADERAWRYRHPLPTGAAVREHLMLVCSGKREGLVAAVTRLVRFRPLDAELRRRHDAVCRVDATLIAQTQPGVAVSSVVERGIEAYATVGYPAEWRAHHQGGAAGYQARDYRALPASREIIQEGQAFAWNPSIAGTKSEDTILAGAAGAEILTASPGWPLVECEVGGRRLARPDILVR